MMTRTCQDCGQETNGNFRCPHCAKAWRKEQAKMWAKKKNASQPECNAYGAFKVFDVMFKLAR